MYDQDNKGNAAGQGLETVKGAAAKVGRAAGTAVKKAGKTALRKVRKAATKAVAKLAAKAGQALMQFVVKALVVIGPAGCAVLLAVISIAVCFNFLLDERGSTGSNDLDPDVQNPTSYNESTGLLSAIALSEPQAITDAYYKYMSCSSYTKLFGTSQFEFNDPTETSDFACLRDYFQKEQNFYLSDDFIRSEDELLHEDSFYYPEQVIKPVYGQFMTLADGASYYVSLLPYDTTTHGLMYETDIVKDFGIMTGLSGPRYSSAEVLWNNTELLAKSQTPTDNGDGSYTLTDRNVFATTGGERGLWDYGMGSVLQYEPFTREEYISCSYDSADADFDYVVVTTRSWAGTETVTTPSVTAEDGTVTAGTTTKENYHGWTRDEDDEVRHGTVIAIPIGGGTDSVAEFNAYCQRICDDELYHEEEYRYPYSITYKRADGTVIHDQGYEYITIEYVYSFKTPHNLAAILNDNEVWDTTVDGLVAAEQAYANNYGSDTEQATIKNSHINLPILKEWDQEYDKFDFADGGVLEATFENSGAALYEAGFTGLYPIQVALVNHAATFSGNIHYINTSRMVETELRDNTYPSSDLRAEVQLIKVSGGCGEQELTAHRTGTAYHVVPQVEETTSPWGFAYLEQYSANYEAYVPNGYVDDREFLVRTASVDASGTVKTEYIENLKFLLDLDLLQFYNRNLELLPTESVGINDSKVVSLAGYIDQFAGNSKLDELMLGAVVLNRIKSFACTDTWADYSGYSTTSDRAIASAVQCLSGQFTIPENVTVRAGSLEGEIYLVNGGIYYGTPKNTSVSTADYYGRPTYDSGALKETADRLGAYSAREAVAASHSASLFYGKSYDAYKLYDDEGAEIEQTGYTLFQNNNFDVMAATNMQVRLQQSEEGLRAKLNAIWGAVTSLFDAFFNQMETLFPANTQVDTFYYTSVYNEYDVRSVVYHAIAFGNQIAFSTAESMVETAVEEDNEGLAFLFVGKDGSIGIGTLENSISLEMVPGIGTSVEGFSSPTEDYCDPLSVYSGTAPYVQLAAANRTSLFAVASGVITDVGKNDSHNYGKYATLQVSAGGSTYEITYGNLDTVNVSIGTRVTPNTLIGRSGANKKGNSCFLLAVKQDGVFVDPLSIFYQYSYVASGSLAGDLYNENGTVNDTKIAALNSELSSYVSSGGGEYHTKPKNPLSYLQCTWWAHGRGLQYVETVHPNITLQQWQAAFRYRNGGDYVKGNIETGLFNYGYTPKPNSLVCFEGSPGHVEYVEAVDYVNEYYYTSAANSGVQWLGVQKRSFDYVSNSYGVKGIFIYLDEPLT